MSFIKHFYIAQRRQFISRKGAKAQKKFLCVFADREAIFLTEEGVK